MIRASHGPNPSDRRPLSRPYRRFDSDEEWSGTPMSNMLTVRFTGGGLDTSPNRAHGGVKTDR